jgi:hypothetical protein
MNVHPHPRQRFPLRQDPRAVTERSIRNLSRVVIGKAIAGLDQRRDATQVLIDRWPHDDNPVAALVLRAASEPPAYLAGNAGALGRSLVEDLIATIGQVGAGARLLQSGLQFVFDSAATLYVPALQATASLAAFVGEMQPIGVHDLVSSSVALVPRKLATIAALTREMIESSNAEAFVTSALSQSVGLSLDNVLFDANPATSVRPAGLRYNIAALTASAATDPHAAMIQDLTKLAAAVAVIGGNIVFVAAPARVPAIQLWSYGPFGYDVLGSPALAANDLIAVASNGLASAVDAVPEIEASRLATLHMEDATPLPIGSTGTPPTVAAPARSLWQTDTVGIKIRFNADWALRDSRALSWTTVTGW